MKNRVEVELVSTGSLDKDLAKVGSQIQQATAYAKSLDATLKGLKVTPSGTTFRAFKDMPDGSRVNFGGKVPGADAVKGAVRGLTGEIETATKAGSGGIFGQAFWGSFAATGALMAVNAITAAVGQLSVKLFEAATLQTKLIASASDVSTNLGIGIQDGIKLQEDVQTEIAKIAAALPGVTKDYNSLYELVGTSVSSVFKGDSEGYKTAVLDITKRAGILAAKSGADPTMAGSGLNRFIAGTTGFQEVMMIDIFQKNAQFQQALRDGLTNLGVSTEDWKKLTTAQRLKITQDALKIATPDSLLNAFKGTAEEVIQKIQTDLFDPLIGVFGFMRRVGAANNRRVVDAFTQFLQNWDALARQFFEVTGIKFDPMLWLIKGLDVLADVATWLSKGLDKVKIPSGGFKLDWGEMSNWAGKALGKWLSAAVELSLDGLSNLDAVSLGAAVADFNLSLIDGFWATVANINWSQVAHFILLVFEKLVELFWGAGKATLGRLFGLFGDGFKLIVDANVKQVQLILNVAGQFFGPLTNLFRQLASWIPGLPQIQPTQAVGIEKPQGAAKPEENDWLGGLFPQLAKPEETAGVTMPQIPALPQPPGVARPQGLARPAETGGIGNALRVGTQVLDNLGVSLDLSPSPEPSNAPLPRGESSTTINQLDQSSSSSVDQSQVNYVSYLSQPQTVQPLVVPKVGGEARAVNVSNSLTAPITINGTSLSVQEVAAAVSQQLTDTWNRLNQEQLGAVATA